MTTSIRNTILNSLNVNERQLVTDQYNNILGTAVSALEKRESFAVEQIVRKADNQYGYGEQATALIAEVGLNTSAVTEDEPAFLQAGDNQPPLVTSPYAAAAEETERVKPPYTEEDAQAHVDSASWPDGEAEGDAAPASGLVAYADTKGAVVQVILTGDGLSKKGWKKLNKFIAAL